MSKICPKCQATINDDDRFCAACGAEVTDTEKPVEESAAQPVAEPTTEPSAEPTAEAVPVAVPVNEPVPETTPVGAVPDVSQTTPNMEGAVPYEAQQMPGVQGEAVKKSRGKGLLIALIIIIAALVIGAGILVYFLVFSGGGYEEAIDAYVEYTESYDQDDLVKAIGKDALIYYVEEECGSDMDTFYKGCEIMEKMNGLVDMDVDYKITDAQKMSSDELEEYEADGYEVSEGYTVDVEISARGGGILSGLNTDGNTETLTVIKFGSDWCVTDAAEIVESIIQSAKGVGALSGLDLDLGDIDF